MPRATTPRHGPGVPVPIVAAVLSVLSLASCGGGGGGGGGGGPDPDLKPPTFRFTSFQDDVTVIQAGRTGVSWVADDEDDEATVSVFADRDGNLDTTADQFTFVDEVVDANGQPVEVEVDLAEVPAGSYELLGRIRDGKGGGGVVAAPGRLVVENRAMVIPFGDGTTLEYAGILPREDGSFDAFGRFRGVVQFDARRRIQSTSRNWDLFVAHHSARGVIQWLSIFPSSGDLEAGDFVRAANGDLLLAGSFGGTLTLPDGSTARGQGFDVFVARVSAEGEQLWVRTAASGNYDAARGIALLSDGSFVVAGPFNVGNTTVGIDFGVDRNGTPVTLMSAGIGDAFVARYESDGTPIWARSAGGVAEDGASAVAVLPGDRIVVGGEFQATALFDGGAQSLSSVGATDAFLAEWSADGAFVGVDALAGPSTDSIAGLAAGADGNLLVLANSSSMELDVAGQRSLQLAMGSDVTLSSFTADGRLSWALGEAVGTGACVGTDLLSLADGSVLVAGTYADGARFGGGGPTLPAGGSIDGFLSRRAADGTSQWVHRFASEAVESDFVLGAAADGTLWVAGDRGSMDLEVITQRGSVLLPAATGHDFLARFHPDGELGRDADPSLRVAGQARIDLGRLGLRIDGTTAYLQGMDDDQTSAAFRRLVDEHPLVGLLVILRANGPDFGDGHLEACRLIAEAGIETHIAFNGSMYGGGVDLFLGGRRRTVEDGAIVGVRSWIDTDRTQGHSIRNDRENPLHTRYLQLYDALGISSDYYWFYLETPRTTFRALTRGEMQQYGVVTD